MPRFEQVPTPQQYAEQVLANSQATLRAAVAIVSPENPEADPQIIFPNPNVPLRAEGAEPMQLSDKQKEELMARADELGFGRAESIGLSEQGLQGAIAIIEGGQPHKMLAEARLVAEDPNADSLRGIIITASAQRKVESEAEIQSAVNLFGGDQAGKTEYDIAEQVLRALPDFREPIQGELSGPVGFSYDIHNDYETSNEVSGQLVRVGSLGSTTLSPTVHMLRVDREDYINDKGEPRYRKQPDTAELLGIIDAAERKKTPLAFITSGVYRPSRAILTALAGLKTDRHIGIATYGNDFVNEVRGTELPPPVKQLPGELQYMAEKSVELEAALEA